MLYKLIAGYLIMAVFAGIVIYLGFQVTGTINSAFDKVAQDTLPRLNAIKSREDILRKNAWEFIELVKQQAPAEQLMEQSEKFETEETAFLQLVNSALEEENKAFVENKGQVGSAITAARGTIVVVALLTLVAALGYGGVISAPFSRRITRLQIAAEAIGEGDLDTVIDGGSRDELGMLAASLNGMAVALKHSRDELVTSSNYLTDVINSMIESLIVIAPDGTIQSVNIATCALLGYNEEPVGQPFTQILPEMSFDDLVAAGFIRNEEKTYLSKEGKRIPVAFSGSVMWNPDNTIGGIVCVAQDITERKQAEELLHSYADELRESNEELREFAYIVSHDLRAPLVNIKGFSGELTAVVKELETRINSILCPVEDKERERIAEIFRDEVPEALDFINSSVNRMDALINSILQLSRLGHRQLKSEPLDVKELVETILKTLSHQLEQRNAEVTLGPLPELVTDKTSLEQIMGNLLDNAVKYLDPQRPGKLEIFAESAANEIVFHIRDNGRGIAREDFHKVFEIFRRAGKQDVKGEGMGLTYVKTLVRRLGGHIWCESELAVGTTFSIALPVHRQGEIPL